MPDSRAAAPRPRVLCVDDDDQVLKSLVTSLRRRFDVTTADSGTVALRILSENTTFAVIISDYLMPGMNGVALLAEVARLMPGAVRILFTGQWGAEVELAAAGPSAFRLLGKPLSPADLLSEIDQALAKGP